MCFRPAEVSAPQVCPQCGAEIGIVAGIKQKNCPFCKTELPDDPPVVPAPVLAPASSKTPDAPAVPPAVSENNTVTGAAGTHAKPAGVPEKKPFNPFDR